MPNSSLAYSAFSDISDGKPQVKIIKSKSFLSPKNPNSYGPRPKPVSGSIDTDALVSLAWTGEAISPLKSSDAMLPSSDGSSSPSDIATSPLSSSRTSSFLNNKSTAQSQPQAESSASDPLLDKRRSVLRKQKSSDMLRTITRPWTLAMVITDDGITDEKLVDDLEDMRIKDNAPNSLIPDPYPLSLGLPPGYHTQLYDSFNEYPLESGEIVQEYSISSINSSWSAARQALLLCRELVRTERRYLTSLRALITNGTSTPPPPSMLSYLPGLITASDALLNLMEQNPSVQGVSHAFMTCKDKLSASFLSWCGVVGQFFDSEEKGKNKGDSEESRLRATSLRNLSADSGLSITVVSEPNKIRRNSKARPTVRDLAILPTQRIVRYVLLFKELHSLTPPTLSSFAIVENAVQVAVSIAQMSDKAQAHLAFEQPSLNLATTSIVLTPS
ncbi:hypothetical protein GALMADRAFT_218642 [Galerina marginata CBS 339.88]|uniref:DH domain-containing protein n=1 Tax=Galerina marginata (strain CBS 339.88) TaxID=685588 RepID=A0A067TQV4_GALM3|nr:hypothetical protein GALMADRAFT_218642 [Galerina marginata CBS 339.88]